ncbi:MAG: hypothetical protein V4538_06295 [Bacteroidota bacterium]
MEAGKKNYFIPCTHWRQQKKLIFFVAPVGGKKKNSGNSLPPLGDNT